jgi:hypothetical protein
MQLSISAILAMYPHLGKHSLYGHRTTNFVESRNAAAVPIREMPPLQFFDKLMQGFMDTIFSRKQASVKWKDLGEVLTPYAEKLYNQQHNQIGYYTVKASSPTICFVWRSTATTARKRKVDIEEGSCTYDQFRTPCVHFLAALNHFVSSSKLTTTFKIVI